LLELFGFGSKMVENLLQTRLAHPIIGKHQSLFVILDAGKNLGDPRAFGSNFVPGLGLLTEKN
jgi:hypothetical protein